MGINKMDLLTVEGEKYITLEVLNYEGKNYAFLNKLTEAEEVTKEYFIFEILGDGDEVLVLDDYDLRTKLIPMFENLIKKDIEDIINE